MNYITNCGCTETQQTVHCQETTPCDCEVRDLGAECVLYKGDDIQCKNVNVVLKNTVLSVALKNIIDFFCLKFDETANRFKIVNIGLGAKMYKTENLLGQKEFRTITSTDSSVTIVEGTSTIDFSVPDYPIIPTASNVGTGAGVFKELSLNDYKFRKIKTENSGAGATILKTQVENTNDISITAKTITSTDSSVVITSTTDNINLTVPMGTAPDGSETKVTAGTNVTITGAGTTVAPYVVNSTDTNTTYTAGTAMSLVGTTFNNTAPDQTVSLTQAGATTITGTYPNFTISSVNTVADGSETKINNGVTTIISGLGTIASPYVIEIVNLQKVITYPADFTGTNYTLTNADDNYEIIIANAATAVTITVPAGLVSKIGVGFTQKGTADVSYVASGTTINNPTGLKIKGQYYQTYLSQELATNVFYLGGNTKA